MEKRKIDPSKIEWSGPEELREAWLYYIKNVRLKVGALNAFDAFVFSKNHATESPEAIAHLILHFEEFLLICDALNDAAIKKGDGREVQQAVQKALFERFDAYKEAFGLNEKTAISQKGAEAKRDKLRQMQNDPIINLTADCLFHLSQATVQAASAKFAKRWNVEEADAEFKWFDILRNYDVKKGYKLSTYLHRVFDTHYAKVAKNRPKEYSFSYTDADGNSRNRAEEKAYHFDPVSIDEKREELQRLLQGAQLDPKLASVVRCFYGLDDGLPKSAKEAGKILDLTEGNVNIRLEKALKLLRETAQAQDIGL